MSAVNARSLLRYRLNKCSVTNRNGRDYNMADSDYKHKHRRRRRGCREGLTRGGGIDLAPRPSQFPLSCAIRVSAPFHLCLFSFPIRHLNPPFSGAKLNTWQRQLHKGGGRRDAIVRSIVCGAKLAWRPPSSFSCPFVSSGWTPPRPFQRRFVYR